MVDGATTRISGLFDLGAKVISFFDCFDLPYWFLRRGVASISKYGVSSLSLLHLQYLVAGLWWYYHRVL